MATANLDAADLKAVGRGGMISEDVMSKIWDISNIPLPFSDRAGFGGSADNEYTEWTVDRLADPNLNNAVVDGADITQNDTRVGTRLGNHCQISVKEVQVSSRADASDTIGRDKELAYQVMMRQRELRRDVEAISLSMQGSVADDGATVPGKVGSVFSFIKTNVNLGATGTATGFNATTGLTASVVPGTKRGLTETMVKNMAQSIYDKGGDPSTMMARPAVIRLFSEYMFTASARVATMTTDVGQGEGAATAKGAVNVFVTDFGVTLDMVPNRLMPITAAATSSILFADWAYIEGAFLRGYQVEPLAKTGLSEKRMMSVDWTLKVLNEEALGAIHAIDETIAVVA
jgi:hypothetical protein